MNWISVKDRLPDVGTTVLWYLEGETGIGFYDGIDKLACTHWMPLPLAPGEQTVSSACKEVKTLQEINTLADEYLKDFYWDDDFAKQCAKAAYIDGLEYANQFKATPAKEISDEEARLKMIELYGNDEEINHQNRNGFFDCFIWMRDKLTKKEA
jgi:hypothetical protein